MKEFFGDDLFLDSDPAKEIYAAIKDLPIIDYHCHLPPADVARDAGFSGLGELWLSGDHYKWRAMRLCGVEEDYITGKADYREKFLKYAEILPLLAGNPLYYWTHLELKQIFGIGEPLNGDSAPRIYEQAGKKLQKMRVSDLFRMYKVEYVATTDDPADELKYPGRYQTTEMRPTFRPDKVWTFDEAYLARLGKAAGVEIAEWDDLFIALCRRLDEFVDKGCKITDHGFARFPRVYANDAEARALFRRRAGLSAEEKEALFGNLLLRLTREYGRRGLLMQIHFAVDRNVNGEMYRRCGPDSGFDVVGGPQPTQDIAAFFSRISDSERPETVLYTLNDGNLPAIAALTGAFRHVRMGAAWWFNDTVEGIRKNLSTIAEYSVLGTGFGMLTDSRSFSSYARFDFFRRLLAGYLGGLADRGEYDFAAAEETAKKISYDNIKGALGL